MQGNFAQDKERASVPVRTVRFAAPGDGWRLWGPLMALLLLAVPALLFGTEPAQAQTAWQATYWNNTTLDGEPVLTRRELAIDHNWGAGSPDPRVNTDNFSARWTRTVTVPAGTYRIKVVADDGMRVWVDDRLVLNAWETGAVRPVQTDLFLAAGTYDVRVDYFEAAGGAVAQYERTLLTSAPEPTTQQPTVAPPAASPPQFPRGQWRGAYFNNMELAGDPALVRAENNIDFNWGTGSPDPAVIAPDTFSARWTRTLDLEPGRYRFSITVDDGARLFVDDQLLIDRWFEQAATTYTAELDWPGGPAPIRLDYFEATGVATARFSQAEIVRAPTPTPIVAPPPSPGGVWRGAYFDNVNLAGSPAFERTDPQIRFDWGAGSPASDALGEDRFSVRWSQTVDVESGCYQFVATADDGVRLFVNDELVIDAFTVQSARTFNHDARLPGGPTEIVMEYFENTGVAVAQLTWTQDVCPSAQPDTPPDAIEGQPVATISGASGLNVRAGPSVNFRVVDTLTGGQTVDLLGRNADASWVEIRLPDGRRGWVNSTFMSSDTPFASLPVTT